ncbi:MAG: hypothetical protein ACREO8_07890 [Luteimonas sp.]
MRTLLLHAIAAGLFPLLLTACATPVVNASAPRTIADDGSFALAFGERVQLAGRGTLRYVRVANDSRCPPDVRCVWAGDAEVEFEWVDASGKAESFTLHTGRGDRSRSLDGRALTLESLARGTEPSAQMRIAATAPAP